MLAIAWFFLARSDANRFRFTEQRMNPGESRQRIQRFPAFMEIFGIILSWKQQLEVAGSSCNHNIFEQEDTHLACVGLI